MPLSRRGCCSPILAQVTAHIRRPYPVDTNKRYLARREAALLLSEEGFPTALATLEKLASIGGGPPFRKYGRRVIYERLELLAWAEARAKRVTSTSDLAA